MTTAKDIMHPGAQWIPRYETLDRAAQMMRDHGVGALPVSDPENGDRMCGIITDRDIVVRCVAEGHDPARVTCGDICEGTPRWIDAASDISLALREMGGRQIRRLPVVENKRVIGMISEADIARHLSDDQLAEFVHRVYA
ncbi:CBS domain-containing protein [Streptomyces broussonetiae]|uniref:CBS domain-containing protein n=1 Tax=Streptomyces broussonetiae TaxID=2686304 RepID=A0A6I6MUD0_9ACTN|nr:CBS domain-containing protein [Streptomyces broussonetiae]QHA02634.1 CBS domain-containing protein [Streptomyces broussonetiae]